MKKLMVWRRHRLLNNIHRTINEKSIPLDRVRYVLNRVSNHHHEPWGREMDALSFDELKTLREFIKGEGK